MVCRSQLGGGAFPKINGIAFDGDRTLYTTNYSTGEMFAVRIPIRWRGRPGRPDPSPHADGVPRRHPLARRVPVRRRQRAGAGARRSADRNDDPIDGSLDQPTSLVFVGRDIWITEGQVPPSSKSPSQSRTCPSRWSGAASEPNRRPSLRRRHRCGPASDQGTARRGSPGLEERRGLRSRAAHWSR